MKNKWYFLPYFFANAGVAIFFITFCFLTCDAYSMPDLEPILRRFSYLLGLLIVLSWHRYLIKGAIPNTFKKGLKHGFWSIGESFVLWVIAFSWIKTRDTELASLYQIVLYITFFLAISCHYSWGKTLRQNSPKN